MSQNPVSNSHNHILVVDDDPASLKLIRAVLSRLGAPLLAATCGREARGIIQDLGTHAFSCVVTDYRMPDETGLELMEWLRTKDPSLATILVTAEGEKSLVARSLRGGASDFLDKPIVAQEMRAAVERAILLTRTQRDLQQTQSAVHEVAQVNNRIQVGAVPIDDPRFHLYLQPKHQVGGDFITQVTTPVGSGLLCADVSGHDLKAAFVSAYFQGIVRGMVEKQSPLEEILGFFNRLLVLDWNPKADLSTPDSPGAHVTSLAVTAITFDPHGHCRSILNAGCPSPWLVDTQGHIQILEGRSSPLGWFESSAPVCFPGPIAPGLLLVWSDGLEDLAYDHNISPGAVAARLLLSSSRREQDSLVADAKDDISLIRLLTSPPGQAMHSFLPILCERHSGAEASQIDPIQESWRSSLAFAVPDLPEEFIFDTLLCLREALLNALTHGCAESEDQFASIQLSYNSSQRSLRCVVEDPGPGYPDTFLTDPQCTPDVTARHCGLVLIKAIPSTLEVRRNGSCLVMTFDAYPPLPSTSPSALQP